MQMTKRPLRAMLSKELIAFLRPSAWNWYSRDLRFGLPEPETQALDKYQQFRHITYMFKRRLGTDTHPTSFAYDRSLRGVHSRCD